MRANANNVEMMMMLKWIDMLTLTVILFSTSPNVGDSLNINSVGERFDNSGPAQLERPFYVKVFVTFSNNKHNSSSQLFCGGTIVGTDMVITAAHCLHKADYGK